jgi:hypothetical protein
MAAAAGTNLLAHELFALAVERRVPPEGWSLFCLESFEAAGGGAPSVSADARHRAPSVNYPCGLSTPVAQAASGTALATP